VYVRQAITSNLAGNFVNRLSTQAQTELLQLRSIIQGIVLSEDRHKTITSIPLEGEAGYIGNLQAPQSSGVIC
jgi:hypothetical protein